MLAVLHLTVGRVSLKQQVRITSLKLVFTIGLSSYVFS